MKVQISLKDDLCCNFIINSLSKHNTRIKGVSRLIRSVLNDLLWLCLTYSFSFRLDLFYCWKCIQTQSLIPTTSSLEHLNNLDFRHHTAVVFVDKSYWQVSEHLLCSYLLEEVLDKYTVSRCSPLSIQRITNDDSLDMFASDCVSQILTEAIEVVLSIIYLDCLEPSCWLHVSVTDW